MKAVNSNKVPREMLSDYINKRSLFELNHQNLFLGTQNKAHLFVLMNSLRLR